MFRLPNDATPETALLILVPDRTPLALSAALVPIATVMVLLAEVTVLPYWSTTLTSTGGAIETPATTLDGWTWNPRAAAAAGEIVKAALVSLTVVAPRGPLASSRKPVPAFWMDRLEKVAMPPEAATGVVPEI